MAARAPVTEPTGRGPRQERPCRSSLSRSPAKGRAPSGTPVTAEEKAGLIAGVSHLLLEVLAQAARVDPRRGSRKSIPTIRAGVACRHPEYASAARQADRYAHGVRLNSCFYSDIIDGMRAERSSVTVLKAGQPPWPRPFERPAELHGAARSIVINAVSGIAMLPAPGGRYFRGALSFE